MGAWKVVEPESEWKVVNDGSSKTSVLDQLKSDAPYLAGSMLQAIPGPVGQISGAVGTVLEQPFTTAMAGFPGAKVNEGSKLVNLINSLTGNKLGVQGNTPESTGFTSAKTPAGQFTQLGIDLLAPAVTSKMKTKLDDILLNLGKKNGPELPNTKTVNGLISENEKTGNYVDKLIRKSEAGEVAFIKTEYESAKAMVDANRVAEEANLSSMAHDATVKSRSWFPSWAKKLSGEYGSKYESLMEGKKVNIGDYYDTLKKVYVESDLQNKDTALSGAEKAISGLMDKVGADLENYGRDYKVNLSEIDRSMKDILRATVGKNYGPGEHILTNFRSNIIDLMGETAGDLRVLNSEFAPRLQMKNELFKVLKPFSRGGEFDTQSGVNFFKGAALGNLPQKNPGKALLLNEFLKQSGIPQEAIDSVMQSGQKIVGLTQEADDLGNQSVQRILEAKNNYGLQRTKNAANRSTVNDRLKELLQASSANEEKIKSASDFKKNVRKVAGIEASSIAAYEIIKKLLGR